MRNERFDDAVSAILSTDTRYPREAYTLVTAALDHAIRARRAERRDEGREEGPEGPHVSARQLAEGLRDYMLAEFGPFAKGLLDDLNLRSTDDIGNLVYNLIGVGAFGQSKDDKRSDFHALYDFHEAFVEPYLCEHE